MGKVPMKMFRNQIDTNLSETTISTVNSFGQVFNIKIQNYNLSTSNSTDMSAFYIWPILKDYCFLYACQETIPAKFVDNNIDSVGSLFVPMSTTFMYHLIIFRIRCKLDMIQALGKAFSHAIQVHVGSSVPFVSKRMVDRFILGALYLFVTVGIFFVTSVMINRLIFIKTIPSIDPKICNINENYIPKAREYGVGLKCFNEILNGIFETRICMMECEKAAEHLKINSIGILNEKVSLRLVWKVLQANERNINSYLYEVGFFQKWLDYTHSRSYKYVKLQKHENDLDINTLQEHIQVTIIFGNIVSTISFLIEIIIWKFKQNIPLNKLP